MHPWHDVDPGTPEKILVYIEVPKGSKNKYEIHKPSGLLKVDRVLFSSMHYPANYGFIPKSYCDDGDPLDVLVLGQETVVPGVLMEAIPIGVMKMKDQGEGDDKVIAVHANDPEVNHIRSINELSPHRMKEIRRFFEDYKLLENKSVEIAGVLDRDAALKVITEALEFYKKERTNLMKAVKS